MPFIAILTGLIVLALQFLASTSQPAFILPVIGTLLIVGGAIAMIGGKVRMHAMHIAAMMGLAALADGLYLISATETPKSTSIPLAALALIFLILCIKSFIDARRNPDQTAFAHKTG